MSEIMSPCDFEQRTGVSRETMQKFDIYAEILVRWQKSINLVSNNSLDDMWRRHFFDSVQLSDFVNGGQNEMVILDIGSGAGFPGLVLSILGVGKVHLVESVGKKCSFMKQVINNTGIDAVVHNERIENLEYFPVDLITSRACAELEKLLELGRKFIGPETRCLFLKGGRAEQEISQAKKRWKFNVKKYTSKSEESGMILDLSEITGCQEGKQ